MTALAQLSETVLRLGVDLKSAQELAEEAKKDMSLMNKSTLRKLGLTTGDIDNLILEGKEVFLEDRLQPLFQASDVHAYINSRKVKPTK